MEPYFCPLIHYAELNKRGWWRKRLNDWVRMAFHSSKCGALSSIGGLKQILENEYGLRTDRAELEESLDSLVRAGSVLPLKPGWKLSEAALSQVSSEIALAKQVEEEAAAEWKSEILERYRVQLPEADSLWDTLIQSFVKPILTRHGVTTFTLITGMEPEAPEETRFTIGRILRECKERHPDEKLRQLIDKEFPTYFTPRRPKGRRYLLGLMECVLAMYSSGVDRETLEGLYDQPAEITLLLDTNFLFSLLELHDNPLNEDAKAIIEFTGTVDPKFLKLRLCYSEATKDEFVRNLDWVISELKGYRWRRELSAAVVESSDLPGLVLAFQRRNAQDEIEPEAFFGPFRSLQPHVERLGIELFEEKLDYLKGDQSVIDDANEQFEFLEQKKKGKSWEAVWHDVLLWHLVREKRPPGDSAINAKFFLLTCDYRLMGFDQYKCRKLSLRTPICMLPGQLLQLVRFFVPRSEKFDEAVLHSLRLPSLLTRYDPESEQVTLRITQGLARFKDLPAEVARDVLKDEVLKGKIRPVAGNQQLVVAMIENDIAQKLAKEKERREFVEREALAKHSEVRVLEEKKAALEAEIKSRDEKLAQQEGQLHSQSKELDRLRNDLTLASERQVRSRFLRRSSLGLIVCVAVAVGVPVFLWSWSWKVEMIFSSALVFLWLTWVTHKARELPELKKAAWFAQVVWWAKVLKGLVIAAAAIAGFIQLIEFILKFVGQG